MNVVNQEALFLCALIAIPPKIVARINSAQNGSEGTSLSALLLLIVTCIFEVLPVCVGFGRSDVTLADNVSVATLLFHNILINKETLPPFAIVPDWHVTIEAVAEHPAEPDTKLAPVGSVIVVTTLVAV